MSESRTQGGKVAAFMKWVGVAAALLSFGTAIYQLLHSGADVRDRQRIVAEQHRIALAQQAAGDYAAAWDSLALAAKTADRDGVFAKLTGGLDADRKTVRAAQEDLAMEWLRAVHAPEGHRFAEIVDKVEGALTTGAANARGPRKADLLAHLGWGYFLKQRDGEPNLRPQLHYRDAVAADATNPYANVFWGHLIVWNGGSLDEASARFATAVASKRARSDVRRFQLAAFANHRSDVADAAWLRVVNAMHQGGEALDDSTRNDLYGKYYVALNDATLMRQFLAAVPAAEQVELQRMLLQSQTLDRSRQWVITAVLATTLEAGGRPDEALATWQSLQAALRADPRSTLTTRAAAAVQRLSRHRTVAR